MSYTEIYAFDKEGYPHLYGEAHNAWRGAMAVWREMEERHLPPYIPSYIKACNWYRPDMTAEEIARRNGFTPTRAASMPTKDENPMAEIWALADNVAIPEHERIVLHTTFDHCLVKKENIPAVTDAFRRFGGETNLPEQAGILEKIAADPDIVAVGWNQTSVNADTWANAGGYDEEEEAARPYNCLADDPSTWHYWLFDELICDAALERRWKELGNVPFDDPGPDSDMVLAEDWWHFEKGTEREDIWHWFDERHSKGVAFLLYGKAASV